MDALRFQLLGGLRALRVTGAVEAELDLGGPRPRRLLAALLLSAGRPLPLDRLVELVWGDDAPASARGSVQSYVSNLRRALGASSGRGGVGHPIVLRPGGYQLDVDRSRLDIGALEDVVAACRQGIAEGRPAAAIVELRRALEGWGALLPEMADLPFVRAEAARLDARRAEAFELLQTARLAVGEHHEAIADLRHGLELDPRAERLWALLALAQQRSGRPADAIATLHAAREALGEAGLLPGPELRELEADLYAEGQVLAAVADRSTVVRVGPTSREAAPPTRPVTRPCRTTRARKTHRTCLLRR